MRARYLGLPGMPAEFKAGETLYVTLREDAPFWKPVSVHSARPAPRAGTVVIKGEIGYVGSGAKAVEMRYGIEEYFVPEGEGREIERSRQGGKVSMLVAVDRFGNAGIKAVLIDGVTRYEEKLF
ncbi:MAG: GDYXXLXY domain-containing protein [Alphaproteobacteria bacterium]